MSQPRNILSLNRVAWLLALSTFPLIFMGGLVTSHGAGLAVPDWPNSYGYNMFLFPPSQWVGGIFYEHVHRLLGTVAGFLAVVLTVRAYAPSRNPGARFWSGLLCAVAAASAVANLGYQAYLHHADHTPFTLRSHAMQAVVGLVCVALVSLVVWTARTREPRRWVRRLTLGVLGAVIFQGVLGGLRVVKINLDLAVVHGCFAQAFFCLSALVVLVTSRWWAEAPDLSAAKDLLAGKRAMRWAVIGVTVVYGQLVVGAVMRHYQAGLAIPDFPLAFGKILPPTSKREIMVIEVERARELYREAPPAPGYHGPAGSVYAKWMDTWPRAAEPLHSFPLSHIWLHFAHRVGAVLVSIALLTAVYKVFRLYRGRPLLLVPAILLVGLLLTQVTLGALTVLLRKPADVASMHVACGALVLVTTFVLTARTIRLYRPRPRDEPRGAFEVRPIGATAAAVGKTPGGGTGTLSPALNLRPTV